MDCVKELLLQSYDDQIKQEVELQGIFASVQARSQEFAKGRGLFWKLEWTVNELDPNFHQSWIKFRRFFCQNQVISKKKKSSPKLKRFFWPKLGDLQKKVFTKLRRSPKKRSSPKFSQVRSRKKQLNFPGPNTSKSFSNSAYQSH